MNKREAIVISFVPLTGKGKAVYLPPEFITEGTAYSFHQIWRHPQAEVLHLSKKICLGGLIAYHHIYFALKKADGEILLVNGMASLEDGVVKTK